MPQVHRRVAGVLLGGSFEMWDMKGGGSKEGEGSKTGFAPQ
jgi:hypothetical protein